MHRPEQRVTPRRFAYVGLAAFLVALQACDQRDPTEFDAGPPAPTRSDASATDGAPPSAADAAHRPRTDSGSEPPGADAANGTDAGHPVVPIDAGSPALDYYPLVDGASWTYRHGGGTAWDEDVTLSELEFEGAPAFLLADSPGLDGTRSESILVRDESRVVRVHREEYAGEQLVLSVDYVPGFLRFDRVWLEQGVGSSEIYAYDRTEYDGLGQVVRAGPRSHEYTLEAFPTSVEVPAGRFDGCLRVHRSRVRAATDPVMSGDEDQFWFCPGVGKVREFDRISGQTEELVSCNVPGGACP